MKKISVILFILVFFSVSSYNASNINKCEEIIPDALNSKNLLTYIEENNLKDKITEVCSESLCKTVKIDTLEQDLRDFIDKNIYTKEKEVAIELELKGFKITKIITNLCN